MPWRTGLKRRPLSFLPALFPSFFLLSLDSCTFCVVPVIQCGPWLTSASVWPEESLHNRKTRLFLNFRKTDWMSEHLWTCPLPHHPSWGKKFATSQDTMGSTMLVMRQESVRKHSSEWEMSLVSRHIILQDAIWQKRLASGSILRASQPRVKCWWKSKAPSSWSEADRVGGC